MWSRLAEGMTKDPRSQEVEHKVREETGNPVGLQAKIIDQTWFRYGEVMIYMPLMNELGIIAITEPANKACLSIAKQMFYSNFFHFGAEIFLYGYRGTIETIDPQSSAYFKKAEILHDKLQEMSNTQEPTYEPLFSVLTTSYTTIETNIKGYYIENPSALNKHDQKKDARTTTHAIMSIINGYLQGHTNTQVIYRQSKKPGIPSVPFLPFTLSDGVLPDGSFDRIALRIHPWTSSSNEYQSKPFDKFVISFSMMGMSLEGSDQFGNHYPLLTCENELVEPIVAIHAATTSFYEETQFQSLPIIASMMKRLGRRKCEIVCHLHSADPILLGLKLYLQELMSFGVLTDFIKNIHEWTLTTRIRLRKFFHETLRQPIAILSPLDNLIENTTLKKGSAAYTTWLIESLDLKRLKPSAYEFHETILINNCLKKLKENGFYPQHAEVWKDFIALLQQTGTGMVNVVSKLDNFLKLSNAVLLAIVADKTPTYSVCSIEPCTTRLTQEIASHYLKRLRNKYPDIFLITYFDTFIACNLDNNKRIDRKTGNTFHYQDTVGQSAQALITQTQMNGVAASRQASRNGACTPGNPGYSPLGEATLQSTVRKTM